MNQAKQRGGARKNAGRKAEGSAGPLKKYTVLLDVPTELVLTKLGNGNRSFGIREAVRKANAS